MQRSVVTRCSVATRVPTGYSVEAVKPLYSFLCRALLVVCTLGVAPLRAAEKSPYDLFAAVLMPMVNVLSEQPLGPERAFFMRGKLLEATGVPPEVVGLTAEVALQYPSRVRLHAPLFGQAITLCRQDEVIWVSPGSVVKELLARPDIAKQLPKPDKKFRLKDFKLPLSAKELVFLPALFQVKEEPAETLGAERTRVLTATLMPMLAEKVKAEDWVLKLWINEAGRPVQLGLDRPEAHVLVALERFEYAPSLPPETWAPNAEEQKDSFIVPPARYDQLFRALLQFKK